MLLRKRRTRARKEGCVEAASSAESPYIHSLLVLECCSTQQSQASVPSGHVWPVGWLSALCPKRRSPRYARFQISRKLLAHWVPATLKSIVLATPSFERKIYKGG